MNAYLRKFLFLSFFMLMVLAFNESASAQCPMCKAAVESTVESGQSNAGKGLNDGILYLLAAPYLFVAILIVVFLFSSIRSVLIRQEQEAPNNRNL